MQRKVLYGGKPLRNQLSTHVVSSLIRCSQDIYNQLYLAYQSFYSERIANTKLTGLLVQSQHRPKQATSFSLTTSDISAEPTKVQLRWAGWLGGRDSIEHPLKTREIEESSLAPSEQGKPLHAS